MKAYRTREDAAYARKLQNLGVPVEYDDEEFPELLVRNEGSAADSRIFDFTRTGGTGLHIQLSITNQSSRRYIRAVDVQLPWQRKPFILLDDPAEAVPAQEQYKFTTTGVAYDRSKVINRYIDSTYQLRYGNAIRGLLLAYAFEDIPLEFKHGMFVPATLIILDQFDEQHTTRMNLWVDRSERTKPPRKSARRPIFGNGIQTTSRVTLRPKSTTHACRAQL